MKRPINYQTKGKKTYGEGSKQKSGWKGLFDLKSLVLFLLESRHSLILDFVYAHRAGRNGQIGRVWLPWKIIVDAVLFWAKKSSEITLWGRRLSILGKNWWEIHFL